MILSILKVIGIVFLVILILLIFILGILLLVPIRYQFAGRYDEKPEAEVLVRWSPLLLKVTVNYQQEQLRYIIKLLGGVVMTNQDIPLSWLGRKLSSSENEEEDDSEVQYSTTMKNGKNKDKKDFVIIEDEIDFVKREDTGKTITVFQSVEDGSALPKKVLKKLSKKKKHSILQKIGQKISDIRGKITNIIEKLKHLNEKREALLKVYNSKRFKIAKQDVISYLKTLWKIVKPKKLEGYIHYGFEDPATTGQLSGILAMMLVWYDPYVQIRPDFEKACVDGYLKGNGRFRMFALVKLGIKIIFNKNLIKVIKKVQTIIEA